MRAVSRSEIVQHVRVLVLQISKGYSSAAYPEVAPPNKRINKSKLATKSKSIFSELFYSSHRKSRGVSLPIADIETPQPTIRFAPAIAYLFQASSFLTTIRITRSPDFLSSYDAAYPTAYARTILRLLDGLSRVESIPSLVTLELCDCALTHAVSEASLRVDKTLASYAMKKIKNLKFTPLQMPYNSTYTNSWRRRDAGADLLDVFQNASHLKGLFFSTGRDKIYENFIASATQFDRLIQVEFGLLFTDAPVFSSFIASKLQQLKVLIIAEGHINEPGSWTQVFEVWMQRKSEMSARGQRLKLVVLRLMRLFNGSLTTHAVPLSKIAALTYQLCPPHEKGNQLLTKGEVLGHWDSHVYGRESAAHPSILSE